jgi:hypothetical protein
MLHFPSIGPSGAGFVLHFPSIGPSGAGFVLHFPSVDPSVEAYTAFFFSTRLSKLVPLFPSAGPSVDDWCTFSQSPGGLCCIFHQSGPPWRLYLEVYTIFFLPVGRPARLSMHSLVISR